MGGHGIGKSVLLRQINAALVPEARVMLLSNPPTPCTVESCLAVLARHFGVETPYDFSDLFARVYEKDLTPIVLLYDEADVYSRVAGSLDNVGRALFDALESVRRDVAPRLAVLIAGGLGLFGLRETIGSNFLSRATWVSMRPLSDAEFDALAAPLVARHSTLNRDVLDAIRVASGRNAALTTYGLGRLWTAPDASLAEVVASFVEFQERHPEFARDFWKKIDDPNLSEVPRKIWECLMREGPIVPRRRLLASLAHETPVDIGLDDGLRVLQSAGLIEIEGSSVGDPVVANPVFSILSLPARRAPGTDAVTFQERLFSDLNDVLGHIHSLGIDFLTQKGIVPEAVFSATLAIALRLHGWRVEREALRSAGRTDLAVDHPGLDGKAVIEVKIWGRNDYKKIQEQVASYCSAGTSCAFTVTFSDNAPEQWRSKYLTECLPGLQSTDVASKTEFACGISFTSSLGATLPATHFLVRIPQRNRQR
jgi:hypothetical protein